MFVHLLQQWGAALVGVLATVSIVVGARIALRSTIEPGHSSAMTRVFALGTGAFFTAVCLDFLPDAWSANGPRTPLWIFLGAVVFWGVTHLSDTLFDREQTLQQTAAALDGALDAVREGGEWVESSALRFTPMSGIVLASALSFHTFLEGTAVSLAFHHLTWNTLGFSLAMILHKLPEGVLWGMALASIFPRERKKIQRILLIPAICTLIGVFLEIFLAEGSSTQVVNVATGIVGGGMLYIAFAELLPSLRDSVRPRMTRNWFLVGVSVMFVLNSLSTVFGG